MAASYEETTNSDEQYRLRKQIEGSTGMMTYQDAIDEEIDNAIDAGATLCEITFDEEGVCRKIFNDGNAMNNTDRQAYLTLDSRNKKKQNERNPNKGAAPIVYHEGLQDASCHRRIVDDVNGCSRRFGHRRRRHQPRRRRPLYG